MKKVMILGGTGFLGYYTAKVALERGYEVASLSLDDIKLDPWYPKEVKVGYIDLFVATEDEICEKLKGYDYMVYSVGPDDRETPNAPSYDFFHKHLVDDCAKCFRAAERAGVKKAVVYNSYFTYFNDIYPEAELAKWHPYIRCRVEQAKLLNEQKKNMEVVVLMLPYIFGSMPERIPLWKATFLDRFAYGQKMIFFPKGSTTMINVKHIGEAGIGALEYGVDGEYYPIGDQNKSYNWMLDQMMIGLIGKTRKIVNPAAWVCAAGANSIAKKEAKHGKEAGLNMKRLMLDIMSKDMVMPEKVMDEVNAKLHVGRGELEEGIKDTVDACYPNHSFK